MTPRSGEDGFASVVMSHLAIADLEPANGYASGFAAAAEAGEQERHSYRHLYEIPGHRQEQERKPAHEAADPERAAKCWGEAGGGLQCRGDYGAYL